VSFLPDALLSGLTHLLRLYLCGNYYTSVDPRIRLAPSLAGLTLDDNHIQILDHTSFEALENIRNLSVSENCTRKGYTSVDPRRVEDY
jgi:Leucine-rich repeat (LRR) protein